jgi:hypothetical protein
MRDWTEQDLSGQVPYLPTRRQKVKVFWFFSSKKNESLLFLKKKKQKDFYFLPLVAAYGTWPDNGFWYRRLGGKWGR